MRAKFFKKVLVMVLLTTLITIQFSSLINYVVTAVYEDLENQQTAIENTNIMFDVFYSSGVSEAGDVSSIGDTDEKTHSKELNIGEGGTLACYIKIDNTGVLNNAKIHIDNPNFEIDQNKMDTTYIKNIDWDNHDIELNQIVTGEATILLPITFKKQNEIELSYFDRNVAFTITADYKTENKAEKKVEKTITVNVRWTQEVDITATQNFLKCVKLDSEKVLLEEEVNVTTQDNALPKELEEIELLVPTIDSKTPTSVSVLYNGVKIESDYNIENSKLKITNENNANVEGKIQWDDGKDVYKVIYIYDGVENIQQTTRNIETSIVTKYYTKENKIKKTINNEQTISQTDNLIGVDYMASGEISKQYLENGSQKKAYIQEKQLVEIPDISTVSDLSLEIGYTQIVGQNDRISSITMFLENTYIDKQSFVNVFGENATIKVLDQNEQEIATVTVDQETNENGEFVIQYPENTEKATIKISNAPIEIGDLKIRSSKYFVGNTNVEKEEIENAEQIQSQVVIKYGDKMQFANTFVDLLDANVNAEITISSCNMTTLSENENVQFNVNLSTKDVANALYKNATFKITFPNQVKSLDVHSINLLYEEELKITKAEKRLDENGCIVVLIYMEGTQTDYRLDNQNEGVIVIGADVELYKDIPSFTSHINFDIDVEGYSSKHIEKEFTGNAKAGVFTYSKIEGYNNEESVEGIGDEVNNIELAIGEPSKIITRTYTVVNNNSFDIQNVYVVGNVKNSTNDNAPILNNLLSLQTTKENAKILYSYEETGENWLENVEDFTRVKRYKIECGTLAGGEVMTVNYQISIPENLENNLQGYVEDTVNYEINGQQLQEKNAITFKTPEEMIMQALVPLLATTQEQSESEEEANIDVELAAKTGSGEIKEGDEIYEGQVITYHVKITNTSNKKINNLVLAATQENAVFYNYIKIQGQDPATLEMVDNVLYREDEGCKEYKTEPIVLEPGKSIEIQYEFSVKKLTDTNITSGNIKITADELEEQDYATLKNTIKEAKIKISIVDRSTETLKYYGNQMYIAVVTVENLTDKDLKDIEITQYISEGLQHSEISEVEGEVEEVSNNNGELTLKISELSSKSKCVFNQYYMTEKLPKEKEEILATVSMTTVIGGETYYSNTLRQVIYQDYANYEVTFEGSQQKTILKNGEKLDYICTITGNSAIDKKVSMSIDVPEASVIDNVYVVVDGVRKDITDAKEGLFTVTELLTKTGIIKLVVQTTIDETKASSKSMQCMLTVSSSGQQDIERGLGYILENVSDGSENIYGSISGKAWLDNNKNGQRDGEDTEISGMTVKIFDAESGKKITETQTDEQGDYMFVNLENKKYIVAFAYDKKECRPTIYKKEGVSEFYNSDTIEKILDGENFAITDILDVKTIDFANIDAGFIKNSKFDLKLDKTVTKITIIDGKETKENQVKDGKLAKSEVQAKKVNETTVLMEYKIKVTNEGETVGAAEIVDYKPQDVTFESKRNPGWYQGADGNLYTTNLSNTMINPGENKEVTLVLTKKMTSTNVGTTYNTAEIASATNKENLEDIDSTPKNRKAEEDDISSANVIISIKTGAPIIISMTMVIILIVVLIVILYLKRKGVKHEGENNK